MSSHTVSGRLFATPILISGLAILATILPAPGTVRGQTPEGLIVAWGDNSNGQTNVPAPNTGFVGVAAGGYHSLGLKADGSIVAWGSNSYGQTNVPSPNTGFVAVAAGYFHSLGLKSDGAIVAWGESSWGQTNVPPPNTGFVAVAAGMYHSLGLKPDGSIVAWGGNTSGQLNVPSPNADFIAIAAGTWHSLGLKSDGSIVAWGYNSDGQTNVPSPNTGFVAVAAGSVQSLGLKADGSIVTWTTYPFHYLSTVPQPNTYFIAIAAGSYHSLGLKADGSIVGWGYGFSGRTNVPAPNTGFIAVVAGGAQSLGLKAASDSDTFADICDNCATVSNPLQEDSDNDGVGDSCDNCLTLPNTLQQDSDQDGVGDCCDTDWPGWVDADGDVVHDLCDNCSTVANSDQLDSDADGVGDACDNCATVSNVGQQDSDDDGAGDCCDSDWSGWLDADGDGLHDLCDNCSTAPNVLQRDSDHDGAGDFCDPPLIVWDPDVLSPNRATRALRFVLEPQLPAGAPPWSSAIKLTMVDLQHPNPRNLPLRPPPDFTTYDTRLNGVCLGGTHPGHHCDLDADCPSGGTCSSKAECTAAGEMNGCARWVGKPGTFLESQDSGVGGGTFRAARLQCTPFYFDWVAETHPPGDPSCLPGISPSRVISVVGAEIAPSSEYHFQTYAASCEGAEDTCTDVSSPVTMLTRRSGDVEKRFNPPHTSTQPDSIDVAQIAVKFGAGHSGLPKVVVQLQPNLPELNADINALDTVAVVDAMKEFPYPFSGPCACPSLVTCGALACPAGPGVCVTAHGAGSQCVKTCVGGANIGDPCINNGHCPSSTCGAGFCRDRCGRCTP